jgi:membrane-associated phospholipid phosphatase
MFFKIFNVVIFIHTLLLAQSENAFIGSLRLYQKYSVNKPVEIYYSCLVRSGSALFYQVQHDNDETDPDENGKHGRLARIPGDILTAAKIFGDDFIHVTTEPARWDKGDLVWAGGFAATALLLFAFDQEIYDAINRNRNVFGIRFFVEMGNFFEPVGLMAVQNKNFIIAMGVGYILNFRALTIISGEILEAFFIAAFYSEGIKKIVGRKRPNQGEGPYSFTFNEGTSFPSGHARNITQAAVILSRHIRFLPFRIFAYTVAASVCLQRITSESHWPSDVFVGAMFGAWTAKVLLDYHEQKNLVISPRISPESEYIGFDVKLVLK